MKRFFQILLLNFCFMGLSACNDDNEAAVPVLEVTPAYLDGSWQLVEWNGAPLTDGLYLYITFNRREGTFESYDNLNSMYAHRTTGSYRVTRDERLGYLLGGSYDYGQGEWNRDYIVSDSYAETMVWTACDDASDVQLFRRCDGVPESICNEAQPLVEASEVR